MNKNLTIIFIIIAIIAILGWIFLLPTKENLAVIQVVEKKAINQSQLILNTFPRNEQFNELKNPPIEPFLSIDSKTLENIGPIIEDVVSVFTNPAPQPLSDVDFAVVEQQVFDILYPDYFVNGLSDTQQFYIEQGFLGENYEKIEDFDSEEKIFAFVNTSIDVFEEQGIYSEEDAEKFRNGVNQIWKSLLMEEERYWREKIIGSEFYDKILANKHYYIRKSVSRKISKIFETIKATAIPEAYAADCYRSGGGGLGGSNVSAPCCNCGFNTDGRYIWYVDDCGGGCNFQDLGCLNLYAGGSRPAIWDPATLVCGVG